MNRIRIRLTEKELDRATQFALKFWDAHHRHKDMNHGASKMYGYRAQVAKCLMGFRAELALAKYLRLNWDPKLESKENSTDLGDDIQIRAVSNAHADLIIRQADKKYGRMHCRFILIHAHKNPKEYTVLGWTYGINALSKKSYWQDKGNGRPMAWFIPQEDLFSMDTWTHGDTDAQ